MALLPLFPLGTVLMPGAPLPLQVFEERYVRLLGDLLADQDERLPVFGVVAIREGFEVGETGVRALYPVGCAALVTHVAGLDEGRFMVVAKGTSRFRLDRLVEQATTPYAVGDVVWLGEPEGNRQAVSDLAARLRAELAAYRHAVGSEAVEPPDDDRDLPYRVPEALPLDLADRQLLLASSDTEARLRLAVHLVRRERALAESLGAVGRPPERPLNLN